MQREEEHQLPWGWGSHPSLLVPGCVNATLAPLLPVCCAPKTTDVSAVVTMVVCGRPGEDEDTAPIILAPSRSGWCWVTRLGGQTDPGGPLSAPFSAAPLALPQDGGFDGHGRDAHPDDVAMEGPAQAARGV